MIITEQKSFEDIRNFLAPFKSVFICGCSECATLCKTGGEDEVKAMKQDLEELGKIVPGGVVLDPACHRLNDKRLFRENQDKIDKSQALLVLACGNGTQTVARITDKPVYPGCDSLFLGEIERAGVFKERCQLCGDCLLDITGGICPLARCSKGLLNGPCGGSVDGKCEVDPEIDCAWQLIIDRLKEQGNLEDLQRILPPKDWSTSGANTPRSLSIRSDKEDSEVGESNQGEESSSTQEAIPGGENSLEQVLEQGKFAVTAEVGPPKGADSKSIEKKTGLLQNKVDAINVTDNQTAIARMSSIAGAAIVARSEVEPVAQLVCRDRNRLALQSDVLGAVGLGVRNFLCLSGDHQKFGNHPQAKNVYDLDSIQLISALKAMRDEGRFLSGDSLSSSPSLFIGAVENPYADPFEFRSIRLKKKIKAGCDFIQTQAVFEVSKFERWISILRDEGLTEEVHILAGVIPIKSVGMARYMKDYVSGVSVPDKIVVRMEDADDPKEEGRKICGEIVQQLKDMEGIGGIHIMAIAWEEIVPKIVEESGLLPRPTPEEV